MKPDVLDEFLQQPFVGVIATLRKDGMPYTVPVWWLRKGGAVWLTGTYSRVWCQQLLKDPRTSLCIEAGAPLTGHVGFDGLVTAFERPNFDIWPFSRELAEKYVGLGDPGNADAVDDTPCWRSSSSMRRVQASSFISSDSVISISRRSGSSPLSRNTSATRRAKPCCVNCTGEALTHTRPAGSPWSSHCRLGAGCTQHPLADRQNQARFLGHRNELVGPHRAELGMRTAQQRLHAGHAARHEIDLRLVMQRELAALERAVQAALEVEAGLRAGAHARIVVREGADAKLSIISVAGQAQICYKQNLIEVLVDNGPLVDVSDIHVRVAGSSDVYVRESILDEPLKRGSSRKIVFVVADVGAIKQIKLTPADICWKPPGNVLSGDSCC